LEQHTNHLINGPPILRRTICSLPIKTQCFWLEGEEFETKEQFLDKVKKILDFQQKEKLVSVIAVQTPSVESQEEESDEVTLPETTTRPAVPQFKTVKVKKPSTKKKVLRWTKSQLAAAIVDRCIAEMKRVLRFTGPSVRISDVYSGFNKNEFTYPALIGAIRDELQNIASPGVIFPVGRKARFWAESSAGKGKNFNFKIQRPDKLKPNGWSAVAQIHVLWE
jgi:hypothetical protein